jgi:hypothetical protein
MDFLLYLFSDAFNPIVRTWMTTSHDAEQFFSHCGVLPCAVRSAASCKALVLGGKAIGPYG